MNANRADPCAGGVRPATTTMVLMTAPSTLRTLSPDQISHVQATLLTWWDGGHRDLPWRRTLDPYHVIVSEFMLQQTQVSRVVPKFLDFVERFPALAALAAAPTAEVIRAWAG